MKTKTLMGLICCSVIVTLFGAATASADMMPFVEFEFIGLDMHYSPADRSLNVTNSNRLPTISLLTLKQGLNPVPNQWASIIEFFDLDLDLTVAPAEEGYKMTGTFSVSDMDTATPAILASFTSTKVEILGTDQGTLRLEGVLDGFGDDSILVNRGDPGWTFSGMAGSSLSLDDATHYTAGHLVYMSFGVAPAVLSDLFDGEAIDGTGNILGTVVPVPAALVLGLIGLATVGWRLRKVA